MGQKANPISLRLEQTNRHFDSCWFNEYNYTKLLNRDLKIQSYINLILKQIKYGSARFFIQHLPNKIKINVFFINPKSLRKTTFKSFQLKEFSNSSLTKTIKKNQRFKPTQLELKNKNSFLKKYTKQTTNKASLLNYLLLKSKDCFEPLSVAELYKTVPNSVLSYKYNTNQIQFFLRFLLLKNLCLNNSFNYSTKSTSFLFSNLLNFKLLNDNKVVLTTEFFEKKITEFNKQKQQNALKSNFKFYDTIKLNSLEKQETLKLYNKNQDIKEKFKINNTNFCFSDLQTPLKPNLVKKKEKITINQEIIHKTKLNLTNSLGSICTNNITDFVYLNNKQENLQNKINKESLSKSYIFSSLVNKESLKKTHSNYNKLAKHFSFFSSCLVKPNSLPFLNKQLQYKNNEKKVLFLSNALYKKHLESQLSNSLFCDIILSFFKFSNEKQSALFLADEIAFYLEKRVPFFKIKNQILKEVSKKSFLKGLRITCSGRVGGRSKKAQRTKIQVIKHGQTSLHVFSSKIDFACKQAYTNFGLLGIKVWVCYH